MNLYEAIREGLSDLDKNALLSKIFAAFPDITEEDEDYLNSLTKEEIIQEIKDRGWVDMLDESDSDIIKDAHKFKLCFKTLIRDEEEAIKGYQSEADNLRKIIDSDAILKQIDETFLHIIHEEEEHIEELRKLYKSITNHEVEDNY